MESQAPVALALPEILLHEQAAACLQQLRSGLQSLGASGTAAGAAWVIDASALRDFDSSALAVLLACRRTAQALGGTLQVHHLPPALHELASVYGVLELLG
jgi:phospholipid transport system transporter-binding protein